MQNVKTHNGHNYINVTNFDLQVGDTLILGNHCGQVESIEGDGVWVTAKLAGHPYETQATNVRGEAMFHLVVKDQAEWDARQQAKNNAYESLNS